MEVANSSRCQCYFSRDCDSASLGPHCTNWRSYKRVLCTVRTLVSVYHLAVRLLPIYTRKQTLSARNHDLATVRENLMAYTYLCCIPRLWMKAVSIHGTRLSEWRAKMREQHQHQQPPAAHTDPLPTPPCLQSNVSLSHLIHLIVRRFRGETDDHERLEQDSNCSLVYNTKRCEHFCYIVWPAAAATAPLNLPSVSCAQLTLLKAYLLSYSLAP